MVVPKIQNEGVSAKVNHTALMYAQPTTLRVSALYLGVVGWGGQGGIGGEIGDLAEQVAREEARGRFRCCLGRRRKCRWRERRARRRLFAGPLGEVSCVTEALDPGRPGECAGRGCEYLVTVAFQTVVHVSH